MKLDLRAHCWYFQVCVCAKIDPCELNFRAVCDPKYGQNRSIYRLRLFSWQVSTGFTRNLIYKLVGATFAGV